MIFSCSAPGPQGKKRKNQSDKMGPGCQISVCYTQQHTWAKKKGKIRVYWVNLIGLGLFFGFFSFLIKKIKKREKGAKNQPKSTLLNISIST